MNNVILASASPRRKELLGAIFKEFKIVPANIDETIEEKVKTKLLPEKIAEKKAKFIAKNNENALVIGCDTAVILGEKVLGKPKDRKDAFNMIQNLSGKTHSVITGCALCYKGKEKTFSCETKVTFNNLSEKEIEKYLNIKETLENGVTQFVWTDKAGAYGIQNNGEILVKNIDGDFNNVVGMPVDLLKEEIEKFLK